jgi:hypothetical protein
MTGLPGAGARSTTHARFFSIEIIDELAALVASVLGIEIEAIQERRYARDDAFRPS